MAVVYVSEGKDASVVDALESTAERACATHGARVVNVFRDVEYNRTGFTLGVRVGAEGDAAEPLGAAATALAERALSLVDLRDHAATHPRCGVVDHISCHAVGDADASVAVSLARGIGARVGDRLGLPVLLYGAASAKGAGLADPAGGTVLAKPRGPGPAGPARTSWPAAPWTPSTARGTCLPSPGSS